MTRFIMIFILVLAIMLTILADLLVARGHQAKDGLWGASVAGYWAAFGFGWFILIVAFSKVLGHHFLERSEDYYSPDEEERGDG
jgi:hypothetical protein